MRFQAVVLCVAASAASAQVDNPVTVVPAALTTGGVSVPAPLGAFGYDPVNDRMFVAGFSNGDQEMRRIDNVSTGSATFTTLVTATPWLRYMRENNLDLGISSPTPSSVLLNPLPIGSRPAYSEAWVFDATGVLQQGTGTTAIRFPELTKKAYSFNLQQSAGPNAMDVFTTQMTVADMQAAVGLPATATTTNMGRQPAWSGDGQSLYFNDTSNPATQHGGIWKISAVDGTLTRLAAVDFLTEPAVLSAGGIDTIYFAGTPTTGNEGGIDSITHDGTNTGTVTVAVSAADLADFLELSAGTITVASMTSDADGNLYFNNTNSTSNRRGIFRLDAQGRLSKVVGYEERKVAFGGSASGGNPNSNTLRMQPRLATVESGEGSFQVRQVLYVESSGVNAVAGANVFAVGDFNRDNLVDQADVSAFKDNLTLRGVMLAAVNPADHPKFRYDLNGNNEVTWKDVKILQQFYGFFDGDADINKTVDIGDFAVLATNFNQTGKRWTEGDFDGDEAVGIGDFALLAANFNQTFPGDLPRSAVPEPAGALMAAGALVALHRRRR